jgi:hypothetical protein
MKQGTRHHPDDPHGGVASGPFWGRRPCGVFAAINRNNPGRRELSAQLVPKPLFRGKTLKKVRLCSGKLDTVGAFDGARDPDPLGGLDSPWHHPLRTWWAFARNVAKLRRKEAPGRPTPMGVKKASGCGRGGR